MCMWKWYPDNNLCYLLHTGPVAGSRLLYLHIFLTEISFSNLQTHSNIKSLLGGGDDLVNIEALDLDVETPKRATKEVSLSELVSSCECLCVCVCV